MNQNGPVNATLEALLQGSDRVNLRRSLFRRSYNTANFSWDLVGLHSRVRPVTLCTVYACL